MRDLLVNPLCTPDDLGRPIPDSPHAVSVCLPTWADNVGYEEDDPRVHSTLQAGYPRFVYHPICRRLFDECRRRFAGDDETALAFPTESAAARCLEFVAPPSQFGVAGRLQALDACGIHAAIVPTVAADTARQFWQHSGEGVSSRQAAAGLQAVGAGCDPGWLSDQPAGADENPGDDLRSRIAGLAGVAPANVFLFPNGMNAVFHLHRALCGMRPELKSVQFGFPYVDSLKVQEKWGTGAHFFPRGDAADIDALAALLKGEAVAGLFTEFPSNPLLLSPDLKRLAELARSHGFPLIVDDTVSGFANVDLLPVADVVCSSLTKSFSGAGDVTGGSLIVNPASAWHDELTERLRTEVEDAFWPADLAVLERNSRDYPDRARRTSTTAQAIADYLHQRREIVRVHYPTLSTPELSGEFLKPHAGHGGLLSIDLDQPGVRAPRFFDALRICKGPNLGTNFSLACPYTILAHYRELPFAEQCGVSRWLLRISVGLEDAGDLRDRFDAALTAVK